MFTDSDGQTCGLAAVAAVTLLVLLPAAAVAQSGQSGMDDPPAGVSAVPAPASSTSADPDGAAPEGQTGINPHALLGELNGGPGGSPTAQRGNPRPGTSTSIPTTNPATVEPLTQRGTDGDDDAVEDTGIAGQCDPVVSLGCPTISEYVPQVDAEMSGASIAPQPVPGAAPADAPAQPATDGAAAPAGTAN